jgi:hypothetical protein
MHIQKNAPKFIGIGGKGSGLALITELLEAHPLIHDPIPSLRFFSRPEFQEEDLTEYVQALHLQPLPVLSGESCPEYLTTPNVAERIAKNYPDAKLFAIVRNPIDRAIMEYTRMRSLKKITTDMTCAQYLTNYPESQTDGFFGRHLMRYFSIYTSLQLYVIVYEDFVKEPLKEIQKLYDFLEIDREFIPKRLSMFAPPPEEPKHRGRISRLIHFGAKCIKKIRPVKVLGPLTPPTPNHSDFFSDQELALFKKTFAADAAQLSHLLHRDMMVQWNLE